MRSELNLKRTSINGMQRLQDFDASLHGFGRSRNAKQSDGIPPNDKTNASAAFFVIPVM